MDLTEIILPRRVLPQPKLRVNEGGDCGACCLAGLFGISIQEAYALQDKDERPNKDKPHPFSWQGMAHALKWGHTLSDGVLDSVPIWPWDENRMCLNFGIRSWMQNIAWFNYVRMGLHGGFYGIANMDIEGRGPLFEQNHWVMICGAKERVEPHDVVKNAGVVHQEILISCSGRNPQGYWKGVRDFLKENGGFNVIMVRPRN